MRYFAESDIDRRRFRRANIEGIRGNILSMNDLEVLNISVGGAAILTAKRVELNREYTVRLYCSDSSFQMRITVIWAVLISHERDDRTIIPLYKAGVKFLDVSSEKGDFIRRCIENGGSAFMQEGLSRITYCF